MSTSLKRLLDRIESRTAKIAIIGLGYVGLPLAVAFAESEFSVVGVDVDVRKVLSINAGESYIRDMPSTRLMPLVRDGKMQATTDYAVLATCDAAIICVPTPLNKTRDPDVRYLLAAGESVARYLHDGMLVVLESTTYPGTTEELLLPILLGQGDKETGGQGEAYSPNHPVTLSPGQDFFLAFSPERIDPGRTDWTVETTPKVIGGVTPACLKVATALYS